MISFDNIDQPSWKYDLLMAYLRVAHNVIYYRKFRVVNPENIPPKGTPTLVIANHQNGMMDAMAILHALYGHDRRQPVFIARGDIFKKDAVAKALRFLKILPVFRTRDGGRSDIEKDLAIFNHAAQILQKGRSLVIFPEAGHQQGHYMNTFKKGFSRIAFTAEEINDYKLNLRILPLNVHYANYFEAREDLTVTCGKPFTFEEFFDMYKETPNPAYLALLSSPEVDGEERAQLLQAAFGESLSREVLSFSRSCTTLQPPETACSTASSSVSAVIRERSVTR